MRTDARHQLLSEMEIMASKGINPRTEGRIGAVLARRLPQLIAAMRELLGATMRGGRHVHG